VLIRRAWLGRGGTRAERLTGVRNLWSDSDAATLSGPLAERVYSSRLLGGVPELVMHGGGNTSVKVVETDRLGDAADVLYVKGSGSDLATIDERGFAPTRLERLVRLSRLDELGDAEMAEELRLACTRADAPAPSVEAILHAILPARFVDHTHADAVLTLTNTPNGRALIDEVYGARVVVVDYVMPGFALARLCARVLSEQLTAGTVGMILVSHGIFTFGVSARESYDRMIELVTLAEEYLVAHGAGSLPTAGSAPEPIDRALRSRLRREISDVAGAPVIVSSTRTPRVAAFVGRDDCADIASRGPMTPDHVIRTKRVPLVGTDVSGYASAYRAYFERNQSRSHAQLTMLDPAPRVVLDPTLGMLTIGRSARDASIARDIALHTLDAIERAEALGGWVALPEADIFDVEYWELEQAKLAKQGARAPFAGEIALVTGAASGIGRATAEAFVAAGAAVIALDRDPRVAERDGDAWLGVVCDVTDDAAVDAALDRGVDRFGGLDLLVLNAGVFPPSARIAELSSDDWRRVMAVNVDANLSVLRSCAPLLADAPRTGRVVVNASKNVHAPGPGAAAYSASKASLTQLARVAAMEWASLGIRVNIVHPNAVFDTGIWDDATLSSRAASYGLSVDEYKRNNLLGVEVKSTDVAAVIVALCTPVFAKTTAAQIPIDGGNERIV
jgi:rhamnose utilization protein RhaD (predicted bifunctional aldolase and dehydrogenase)/NAD(P)-dependent dehydrogenase (short-subunit alcohol dehydrogenase family)